MGYFEQEISASDNVKKLRSFQIRTHAERQYTVN